MIDPVELYTKLDEAIEEYSKATYQFKLLDYSKKSVLAKLTLSEEGSSHAERQTKALASDEYKTHCDGLALAEEYYIKCKFKVQNMFSYQDNIRTKEVSERNAVK